MSCTFIWHACAFTLFWHLSVNWQNWLSPKRSHFSDTSSHALSLHAHPPPSPTRTLSRICLSLYLYLFLSLVLINTFFSKLTSGNPPPTLFHADLSFNINFETKFTPPWNPQFQKEPQGNKVFLPYSPKSPTQPAHQSNNPTLHYHSSHATQTHTPHPPNHPPQLNTPPTKHTTQPPQPYPLPTSALDIPLPNPPKPLLMPPPKHPNAQSSLRLLNRLIVISQPLN
jgi:hypothetical protein